MADDKKSRYLQYLPAIFQEDPFLGRFLLPFEEVLQGFDSLLSEIDRFFDPATTDSDFLPWLSQWLALVMDEEWDEAKRRRLIAEAVELYRRRGTVTGLKRYLEIYAGLIPEIYECRWPGGMQIGMASRIGGTVPDYLSMSEVTEASRVLPPVYHDYYVVSIEDSLSPHEIYYRTSLVREVEVGSETDGDGHEQPYVDIHLHSESEPVHHVPATISRRDGLVDERYLLKTVEGSEAEYRGDTFLVDQEELPFCFIVDVRVPIHQVDQVRWDKVRDIVETEKPAHTMCYLRLTPVYREHILHPMQIEIRSRIGVDTVIG